MSEVQCLGSGLPSDLEEKYKPGGDLAGEEPMRTASWNGDYNPPAVWRPIQNSNWTPANRPTEYPIQYIVIHYTQGMGFGPIPFGPGGSAHYGFNLDGKADQYVGEAYIAWHANNWYINCRSIGIEHVGYGRPQDWTDAMLRESARLTAHLCKKYRIPATRQHIIGHSEVQGATHTDPGANFPWSKYMGLVQSYLGGVPKPTPKPAPERVQFVNLAHHESDGWGHKIAQAMDDGLTSVGFKAAPTSRCGKAVGDARNKNNVYTLLIGEKAVAEAKRDQKKYTSKTVDYGLSGNVRVVVPSYRQHARWRIADFCDEFDLDKGKALRNFDLSMDGEPVRDTMVERQVRAWAYFSPGLGKVPYGVWHSGPVPDEEPAGAINRKEPTQQYFLSRRWFCMALPNIVRRMNGLIIPYNPSQSPSQRQYWDGGTLSYWEYFKAKGVLRTFRLQDVEPWDLCLRRYRDASLNQTATTGQGHGMIAVPGGKLLAFQTFGSPWPGLNADWTVAESHNGWFYEGLVKARDWMGPKAVNG